MKDRLAVAADDANRLVPRRPLIVAQSSPLRHPALAAMPEHAFHLTAVLQVLEKEVFLAEALFFPEVSCIGEDPAFLTDALVRNACRLLQGDDSAMHAGSARRNRRRFRFGAANSSKTVLLGRQPWLQSFAAWLKPGMRPPPP